MKVLLINKFYHMAGGAERYVFEWEKILRARGHEVVVFSMEHPRNAASDYARCFVSHVDFGAGGPVERLRAAARSVFSFEARRKVREMLWETRPDMAHVHSYCYQLTPSILGPLRDAGVPVVQTAHEYYHACANQHLYDFRSNRICERCRRSRLAPFWTRCVKGSLTASAAAFGAKLVDDVLGLSRGGIDCVVAPSAFMRDKMIEFGWPARRVVRVPNFVDAASAIEGAGPGEYILFLGRLVAHKGAGTLLRAAERLPQVPMKIAGSGPMEEELQRFASGRGLDNVEFLGFRDGHELKALVAGSRAVAIPSEWHENASIAVLESMAAARCVVASDVGGVSEQVRHGQEGLLFPMGDVNALVARLRRVWDNPEEAVTLGGRGRRRVMTRFSPMTHYRHMMRLFRGLLP